MIDRVRANLDSAAIRYAVIGGWAVIARGYVRATLDFDFFTTDRRVLQVAMWNNLRSEDTPIDVRAGDVDDPLAGVVRIGSKPPLIDIVVGRHKWEQNVIDRAETVDLEGRKMRVPLTSDLILLKLAAGGPIDQQDILRLLAVGPREQLIREVDENIGDLPDDCRPLWRKLREER